MLYMGVWFCRELYGVRQVCMVLDGDLLGCVVLYRGVWWCLVLNGRDNLYYYSFKIIPRF